MSEVSARESKVFSSERTIPVGGPVSAIITCVDDVRKQVEEEYISTFPIDEREAVRMSILPQIKVDVQHRNYYFITAWIAV